MMRAVLASILALCLVGGCHWSAHRAFYPGQWVGRADFFLFDLRLFWLAFAACLGAVALLVHIRRFAVAGLFALLVLAPCFVPWRKDDPLHRFRAECEAYRRAVATGRPFGDQYVERSDGRTLIYWRWISYGIDDAIGIVYDPEDRLSVETDERAFAKSAHGTLFRVERLEPRWFYAVHS